MSNARRAGDSKLELRLLGPLEVSDGRRSVPIGGPKPRALLALLGLEAGRVVSADRLVEELWASGPPATALHAVQEYVSKLRKALGAQAIETRAPGYVLDVDVDQVDVHRFSRLSAHGRVALAEGDPAAAEVALREALSLWRGSALADFTYEPFAQNEIARLDELRLVVLEERVEADLALGRHADVVSELEALVDAQPLRERPRAQLMLALYRCGRQADALHAYRAARETLVEQLGIEPGPALRALEASILRQDESLLLPAGSSSAPTMQFRRIVTILVLDVVDSIALAGALDPEALGRVLQRYFETVSAALARHGGTVETYAGDAVMAAFGVPIAHEDDALRAARAARDVRADVATLNQELVREHGVELEVRIGIEAGEVVVTETAARRRLVAGEAVGVAARLEAQAGTGEIVLGELAARLVDHAAALEPLGDVVIPGRAEPVRAFRLSELARAAPAFERRLDAPLIGRGRELAVLRGTLKRARAEGSPRAAVVVGAAGVGKSRLAAELVGRARGVRALSGRCLSYGEGITYWPLREAVSDAPACPERDAVLAALDATPPRPAAEVQVLFRRLCETLARQKPLVVVFDDLHWAEPTFLDLVEQLVARGRGPMLVLCVARGEAGEPELLAGMEDVERVVLDALTPDETEALVDVLGGATLETDQRGRIVEAGEGNPFFLEQLVALGMEGGLARELPATVQALLAARLDRLGPGERALLERGAVIGKQFRIDDLVALLDPEAAPTAERHVRGLVARGFVRPVGADELRFRHVLVQQAVYRAAPKRLRAELHERFVARFEGRTQELGDVDEFAGYHLEQAHRLRAELGEGGARTAELARAAGLRLGAAGSAAFRRGDMPATVSLLGRAVTLLPEGDPGRRRLQLDLAIARFARGETSRAIDDFTSLTADEGGAGDELVAAWARMELEYVRVRRRSGRTGEHLLEAALAAMPVFEREREHRGNGRAWLLAGWVHGGHRSDHAAWAAAAERALVEYLKADWAVSTCLGELGAALYWGATPVEQAIARIEELLREHPGEQSGVAYLRTFLGGLVAQRGDFEEARALVADGQTLLEELGLRASVLTYCSTVRGDIELLAGEPAVAEQVFRELCAELEASQDLSHLASRASDLAEAVLELGKVAEAESWTHVAERLAADDDGNAHMMWRPVRARVHARRGAFGIAEELAREGVARADDTDDVNRRAEAYRDLGEVLRLAGDAGAAEAYEKAVELYELKGNVAGVRRLRGVVTAPPVLADA